LLPGDVSPETAGEYRQATRKASRVSPRLAATWHDYERHSHRKPTI